MGKEATYERPLLRDIGNLEDLTRYKPKFGPRIPAVQRYKPPKHYGKSSSSSFSGFSGATTSY